MTRRLPSPGSCTVASASPSRGDAPLRIDQAVHGYEGGHRLLAGSRPFDDAADQLLGSMSDLHTTRLLEGASSYLAGYPFKLLNAYVLARTWAASEMPRPGSVWTHSLIIDYRTLATLEDPCRLLALLRRPRVGSIESFSFSIQELPHQGSEPRPPPAGAWDAISSLYATHATRTVVLASSGTGEDEQLLLALWRQMWPALRRDTAFFGFADDAPPKVDASCVIRFASSRRKLPPPGDGELDAIGLLVEDLPEVEQTPLRGFLGRHAFDASSPRAAVLPLTRLWLATARADQGQVIAALVEALPHANAARLARSVLGQLSIGTSDASPLLSLVDRFGSLEVTMPAGWLKPLAAWAYPDDLERLLDRSAGYTTGTLASAIFDLLASTIAIEDLARMRHTDAIAVRLLEVRPELLDQQVFWKGRGASQAELIRRAATFGRPLEAVSELVRDSLTSDSVSALLEGWPDRLADLVDVLGKAPGGSRLLGAALGRRANLLERAIDMGLQLPPDLVDEVAAEAFKDHDFAYPPPDLWKRLASVTEEQLLPNAMVLSFADALDRGHAGRGQVVRLFVPLRLWAVRGALPPNARRYLDKAFRWHRIHRMSISDALSDSLIATFREGASVSVGILDAFGRDGIDELVGALYSALGLTGLIDFRSRLLHAGEGLDSTTVRSLSEYIRRKEKKWFW